MKKRKKKKVTYYVDPILIKKFKHLSIYLEDNLSNLASRAIESFIENELMNIKEKIAEEKEILMRIQE